jgi:hypothetical protein
MPSDVAQRLVNYWGQSLSSRRGASSAALLAFEARHAVKLPSDMRDYLLQLDGTGGSWPDDQDPKGFSFWQLIQIRPVNDELASKGLSALPGLERYFVFADFLTWLWAYAIQLDAKESLVNRVVLIGKDHPIHVADSFSEFVDLYLQNSSRIYGEVAR